MVDVPWLMILCSMNQLTFNFCLIHLERETEVSCDWILNGYWRAVKVILSRLFPFRYPYPELLIPLCFGSLRITCMDHSCFSSRQLFNVVYLVLWRHLGNLHRGASHLCLSLCPTLDHQESALARFHPLIISQ